MGQANFNLSDFVSRVRDQSLARTNRFEIILPNRSASAKSEYVSLMCEQASFPSLNIFTKSFKIFGPSYQRPIASEYGGEGVALTFHVDRDMKIKQYFDEWMHSVISPTEFTVNYQNEYTGSVYIRQLDEQNNITYEIELIDAFPKNINLMELNNMSSNQTHRLVVLFAYRYWVDTSKGFNSDQAKGLSVLSRIFNRPGLPVTDADSFVQSATLEIGNAVGNKITKLIDRI